MDTPNDDPRSTDLTDDQATKTNDELLSDSVDEDAPQPKSGFGERIGEDDAAMDTTEDADGDDGMAPIDQP